jgi:hypothetical protein
MSLRAFNSIQGFSVGENPSQEVILANGDITTVNFTANGISNLGPVGNVKITGGTTGYVLQTDGTGNLSWHAPASSNAAGSNTQIQFNNSNAFGASSNFTFDSSANLLSVSGNVSITKNLKLSANSAISIDNNVGSAGQVLTSNGTNTYWATNFYYGPTPPDFATLNYGDIFFYIDNPNSFQRLYMWVTDGSSDYFYDFLPPSF